MRFGMRKPNFKKSFKARTIGKVKRKLKRSINPLYGKKGMGYIKNPKKAIQNKIYHKTTFSWNNTNVWLHIILILTTAGLGNIIYIFLKSFKPNPKKRKTKADYIETPNTNHTNKKEQKMDNNTFNQSKNISPNPPSNDCQIESTEKATKFKLFGFRSNKTWKKIISIIYLSHVVLFTLLFMFANNYGSTYDVALDCTSFFILGSIFLSPYIFLSESKLRNVLPLFKKKKLGFDILGLIIVTISLFITFCVLVCSHSAEYTEHMGGNHDNKIIQKIDPTCTKDGITVYKCSYCNKETEETVYALGHSYTTVSKTDATEKSEGKITEKCKTCGLEKTSSIPAITIESVDKDSTATPEETTISDTTVKEEAEKTTDTTSTPETQKPADTTGKPETQKPAVTTASPKPETTPTVTEHKHNYSSNTVAATCTHQGYTEYTCSCGDTFKEAFVSMLSHNYSNGYCTYCGTADPDYKNTETVYITDTGSKYHRPGCQHLTASKIPISKDEAEEQGYEPCKVCH